MDHSPVTVIETPRVILRAATLADAEDLFECFRDKEVMRYWSSLPHQTLGETTKWVQNMVDGDGNGVTDFVICLKPDQQCLDVDATAVSATLTVAPNEDPSKQIKDAKVIGKAGIWDGDEIGFLLNRAYWRKGLAFEILQRLIDEIFGLGIGNSDGAVEQNPSAASDEQDKRKDIVADVDPRNKASLGVLKKLGFEVYDFEEKTLKVGDEWVDSVYLSLKRESWLQRRHVARQGGSGVS